MTPVVIDTDGGVDDAAALWWALTDPTLDVLAVTCVWGNVTVEVAAGNVLAVLAAVGREDVPVAIGEPGPVGPTPPLDRGEHIHGADGLGGTGRTLDADHLRRDAPAVLVDAVRAQPGEVSIVTIGPLSNLARAIQVDPELPQLVRELVVMGGVIDGPGNILPLGEANIAHDPTAAAIVVAADWRTPPLLVGLDVTMRATLSPAELDLAAEARTPAAAFLAAPLEHYRHRGGAATGEQCPCHDLVAVLALATDDVITHAPVLPLAVDAGGGPAWGATVADRRTVQEGGVSDGFTPWRVALEADVEAFRRHARHLFT